MVISSRIFTRWNIQSTYPSYFWVIHTFSSLETTQIVIINDSWDCFHSITSADHKSRLELYQGCDMS